MDRPSARIIGLFLAVAPQIQVLVDQWLERAPRKEPVSASVAADINRLLSASRRIVSRQHSARFVADLPSNRPVMPGEILVALLQTEVALDTFARHHSALVNGERMWTRRHGDRCPYCGEVDLMH